MTLSNQEILKKIGRIGYWAPGDYMRKCSKCDEKFIGDKRAVHCLECAIDNLVSRSEELTAWTPTMRLAAMKDAQKVCDLTEAVEKTIADIRLFSNSFDDGSASKDFLIGLENRLRSALSKGGLRDV